MYLTMCNNYLYPDEWKAINEYLENKDYNGIFLVIPKPLRMKVYKKNFDILPDEEKFTLFTEIYSSMEYGFEKISKILLQKLIKYKQPIEITPNEQGYIIVYRGESSKSTPYSKSLSWTLNLDTAKFFANRWRVLGATGKVYEGKVHVDNVIAYINGRKEKEVVVMRGSVKNVKQIKIEDNN